MPPSDSDDLRQLCGIEYDYPDSLSEIIYGDRELALATRMLLTEKGLTELRSPYLSVERSGGEGDASAFLVRCRDDVLASLRLAATLSLTRSGFYREHPDIEARSRVAARLLFRGDERDYHLTHLWVAPAARGRGLGRSLIERCIDEARAADCRRVLVETSARNPAVRLYERLGFRTSENVSLQHPVTGATITWVHLEAAVR